jgi:hypothetical protein
LENKINKPAVVNPYKLVVTKHGGRIIEQTSNDGPDDIATTLTSKFEHFVFLSTCAEQGGKRSRLDEDLFQYRAPFDV